jgi:hypothetical protein
LKWWQSDNVSHEVMLSFSSADGRCVSSCRTVSWNHSEYRWKRSSEWRGWTGSWRAIPAEPFWKARFWVDMLPRTSMLFSINANSNRGVVDIDHFSMPHMVQAVMKTKIMTQLQINDGPGGDKDQNHDQHQIGSVIKIMTQLQIGDGPGGQALNSEYFWC